MGRRGLLPGGQWMSAFGSTQVVAWGPSVQLSQGQSLVTLWRYNFIRDYLKTLILHPEIGAGFPRTLGSRIKKD